MKHSILTLLAAALAALPLAADTSWTGNGSNNLWSNPDNWSRGVPTGAQSENAIFKTDATVEVSGEQQYYALDIKEGSRVEFTGSGSISLLASSSGSGRGVTVNAGCKLVIDGPTLQGWSYQQYGTVVVKSGRFTTSSKGMYIYDDAQLVVEGGYFGAVGNAMYVTNGASVTVKGGTLAVDKLYIHDGSAVTLSGGELYEGGDLYLRDSGVFNFLSGTYRVDLDAVQATGSLLDHALPPRHGRFVIDKAKDGKIVTDAGRDYDIEGEMFSTNCSLTIYGYQNTTDTASFSGDFDLTVDKIVHLAMKSGNRIDMHLNSLTLGAGGITQQQRAGTLYFLGGTRFGAFADWGVDTVMNSTYRPCGAVEYDTLDAFDKTTPRTMTLIRHNLSGMTGLKIYGGGTVSFGSLASPSFLSHLSVADASTLSFDSGYARLRANEAAISSGSVLALKPDEASQYLDVAASASLASGSVKIGPSSPDDPPPRCPVYFAPPGTDPDLSVFDTTDMADGYTLAKMGNVVYMTDGTPVVHDVSAASASALYWTGVEDDSLNTAANWTPAAPDNSAAKNVYFDGWSNMATRLSANLRFGTLYVKESCGPLIITPVTSAYIRLGNEEIIRSSSAYPVIINCRVGKAQGTGNMRVLSLGTGYIALTGGPNTSDKNKFDAGFSFTGDIRLGGTWNIATVSPYNISSTLASRLTLLPDANVTVTNQSVVQSPKGFYVVSKGATFTVGGESTAFAFSSENENFVNGTMTVNCPFSATVPQTFRGDGTLTLASVSDCAGGVKIAGSLTLVPGAWGEAPLSCDDTPTIGPAADWTFAPGGDVSLEIAARSTLTLDTGAHDVVLSAPITGEGNLVKTGSGNLLLNAPDNVLDSLTVDAGVLTLGPTLKARMSDGWTPFLTVRTLAGSISLPPEFEIVSEQNADGSVTYSGRRPKGLMFMIR